jgi:hypothetical protein
MERIICAATWYKDLPMAHHSPVNIHEGLVLGGHNHAQILHQLVAITGKPQHKSGERETGFLTNTNRFVDRKTGMLIAKEAGQVDKSLSSEILYSEDLNYF